ncbi:mechanosensitive ion channel [Gangjinia marincola]|uniref:Mechanosensitive ion channel n=1 Tax=Gangjinia marincola TaxID=578463 RepID=A0ABN1MDI0_9FLAO
MDIDYNLYAQKLTQYLSEIGLDSTLAKYINLIVLAIGCFIAVYILDWIIWKILRLFSAWFAKRSKTTFDDILIKNRVPRKLAHILPILIFIGLLPYIFIDFPWLETQASKGGQIVFVVLILLIVRATFHTLRDYFKTLPRFQDKPIDSYTQVMMIFVWLVGLMLVFAIITGSSVWKFMTGLGAASAIIILIFKDTILGFVASIQVSINDIVRIGDWITFENYGADGDVIEINLATVRVQNFDLTYTTIPTYALISDSFKNWRGMQESDGRRIKRSIYIQMDSVRFLTENEVNRLMNIALIKDYLVTRKTKIDQHNADNDVDKSLLINGRNLTNLGIFRKYIEAYLKQHPPVNKDMMLMSRQLQPTTQGIPLEIYCFSKDKRWENYEYIMANIFDHLIAAIPTFNLRLFELPNHHSFETQEDLNNSIPLKPSN